MKTFIHRIRDIVIVVLILAVILYGFWLDAVLKTSQYTVNAEGAPASFNGFKIAQISDLHNIELDENNETLINMLTEIEPDIIVFTGDMIDSQSTDFSIVLHLAEEAAKIAPCYYVNGNHEASNSEYSLFRSGLVARGVIPLDNEVVTLEVGGETVNLIGAMDPSFAPSFPNADTASIMRNQLKIIMPKEGYNIVLAHRPEIFDVYIEVGADLVICGHTHGGQVRLPFVGGLYANDQGLFPAYDKGIYQKDGATLIISAGIGDSKFPIRFYNPPEITVTELSIPQ